MTVLMVSEVGEGEIGNDMDDEGLITLEARRVFLAVVAGPLTIASTEVLQDPRTPKLGQPHPRKPHLICTSGHVVEDGVDSPSLEAIFEYRSNVPKQRDPDPRKHPLGVTWSKQRMRIVTLVDAENKPMMNTAGDFMKPYEREVSLLVINCEKKVASVPPRFLEFEDSINKDVVQLRGLTFPKHVLLFDFGDIGDLVEGEFPYYSVTWRMIAKRDTWMVPRLNTGTHEMTGVIEMPINSTNLAAGRRKVRLLRRILDARGEPMDKEWFLDKNGRALKREITAIDIGNIGNDIPGDELIRAVNPRDIIVRKFRLNHEMAFNQLPLK